MRLDYLDDGKFLDKALYNFIFGRCVITVSAVRTRCANLSRVYVFKFLHYSAAVVVLFRGVTAIRYVTGCQGRVGKKKGHYRISFVKHIKVNELTYACNN